MVKLKVIDHYLTKIIVGRKLISPALSYPSQRVRKTQYRMLIKSATDDVILKGGFLLTGLINRVEDYCEKQNIPLSINDSRKRMESEFEPDVGELNIKQGERAYQHRLIKAGVENQRGVIQAATASGKTAMMLGVISCFPVSTPVLFLSNIHTPISQFREAVVKYGFEEYNIDSGTIQSFYKLPKNILEKYNIIIIDECHEGLSDHNTMYGQLLKKATAPIRLGFTATPPKDKKGALMLEGLLGPILGTYSVQEGVENKVLSKPKLKMQMLPDTNAYRYLNWKQTYQKAVVENRALNRQIVLDAISDIEDGLTVLILVIRIEHGRNIKAMAKSIYGIDFTFVSGSTDKDVREQIRKEVENHDTRCVIASAVFRKALNIPSLGSVINGCQEKSEIITLQLIGRALRPSEGKTEAIIRDYYIPGNKYLTDHFGRRLALYFKEGWL